MAGAFENSEGNGGFIGTTLGVLFFIILAVFFYKSVDGKSPEDAVITEVKKQDITITDLKTKMERIYLKTKRIEENLAEQTKVEQAQKSYNTLLDEMTLLRFKIADVEDELLQIQQKSENYLSAFRDKKRRSVRGKEMETLITIKGKPYSAVRIRRVTDVGIEFIYDGGVARVGFDELNPKLQEEFAYDPKLARLSREREKKLEAAYLSSLKVESPLVSLSAEVERQGGPKQFADKEKIIADYISKVSILMRTRREAEQAALRAETTPSQAIDQFSIETWSQRSNKLAQRTAAMESLLRKLEEQLLLSPGTRNVVRLQRDRLRLAR